MNELQKEAEEANNALLAAAEALDELDISDASRNTIKRYLIQVQSVIHKTIIDNAVAPRTRKKKDNPSI